MYDWQRHWMGHKKSTPVKEPASLKASPNLDGMQLMVSKSTVMDRPAMEQKNTLQHCQSDPTEILQGISKSSVTWCNTVMNPWNNQQFSRNGQLLSAKGKRLAHALGLSYSNISLPHFCCFLRHFVSWTHSTKTMECPWRRRTHRVAWRWLWWACRLSFHRRDQACASYRVLHPIWFNRAKYISRWFEGVFTQCASDWLI